MKLLIEIVAMIMIAFVTFSLGCMVGEVVSNIIKNNKEVK